ncbi:MAG: cellulase family glycosylhydrolase [Anaerolineae bacterium]|nr:cellulase family glycosylhydrolase [Anaerolineae bacterium]
MNAQSNPVEGSTNWLRKHPGSALVYFVVLPLMACAVLMLPPIALPSRIANAGYIAVNSKGATVTEADGFEITIPEDAVRNGTSLRLSTMSLDNFLNSELARTLPLYLEPRGPLYQVALQGEQPQETNLIVPIPLEIESFDTMDLYALWNQRWFKIPFTIHAADEILEATLNFAPEAVVVVDTLPRAPVIAASIPNPKTLPGVVDNLLVQVNPQGLVLADGGGIAGEPVAMAETNLTSNFSVLPTVSNVDANGARTDLVANMMLDDVQRTTHIDALVDLAVQKVYRGYNLSYEGIPSGDQELFTAFVRELARELHAKQKILSVTLPAPTPISEVEFDTGGYNWALIGRYADEVKISLLDDPRAFEGEPNLQDQYLKWAVSQIDRSKLQLVLATQGRDSTADTYVPVAFGQALKLVGAVTVPPDAAPGTRVTLELEGLAKAGGIQTHPESGLFYFNYSDNNGAQHTVWLENADSVAKKIALALHYNLGGVALTDFNADSGMDARIWTVLENYRSMQPTIVENQLQLVWSVDNNQIGTSPVSDPKMIWNAPQDGGQHQIQVALSVDGGVTAGAPVGSVVKLAQAAAPTPVPPTAEPTQDAPEPTARPSNANTQSQPTTVTPVEEPTRKPVPSPSVGGNFGGQNLFNYGIQIDWTSKDRDVELSQVQNMGFRWVKVQVRWCDMESGKGQADLSGPDDIVNRANARGIKVLFSVLCAPEWSRSVHQGEGPPDNMQDAADFFAGLASRYCNTALGAIEVWNEENLQREWNGAPLSAARYMDMLKAVYPAMKNACPSIVVVSGAMTPTGWNDGVVAIDDIQYLEQLYQNGLKDFSDAIGAHPSGYNVPALCNITDPACNRPEASFRSPFDNRHPSWSFLSTMTGYRSVMARHGDNNKQIWATEFGWPTHTGGSCGGGPCHPAGADNSPEQAGQWYVEAYQWGKQQGWVGVMIAWQLDFDRGELDAFRILGKPAYDMLAGMPK